MVEFTFDEREPAPHSPRFDWRDSLGAAERVAADEELFVLSRGLGRVRLQLGLALVALGRDHRELGFRSLATYARQQLSRSKGWAIDSRAVASRLMALPRMLAAFWEGKLSWCMAALISRFAQIQPLGRMFDQPKYQAATHATRPAHSSATTEDHSIPTQIQPLGRTFDQLSMRSLPAPSTNRAGYTTVEIRCREDAALHYRQLEAAYERSDLPGGFLRFAVTALCHVMLPLVSSSGGKYRDAHLRDRLRCSSPVCDSRNVTCHHVVFRAHQGGEELENLTSPCEFCHLDGVHGGRLRVRGRAPELRWEIGREPVLVVEGREARATARS